MADQQRAIEKVQPASAIATDLDPGEFGLALVVAATWFFAGPLGILPTIIFVYKIVGARLPTIPGMQFLAARLGSSQLREDWRAFTTLSIKDKARFLAGSVELPDAVGDDNGDGAAEGDTQPLTAPIDPLFAALESRPHRLIIGHTGGGKTTLIHRLATGWADQGQRVIVCDPDAAPGQWPGCTVMGGGDDYAGITKALATVDKEFKRRSEARNKGQRQFTPAHLVIDELQETIDHIDSAWEIIEPVLRRGRKLGLHCTLGVQDDQVETLGLHGKSHLLRNTVTVELYQDDRGQRQAAIKNRITDGRPLQTYPVPELASPEDLIVTPEPEPEPEPEPPTLVRPASALTLAELAKLAPSLAAKRGYVPSDQDRAALAGLLEIDELIIASEHVIDRGDSGPRIEQHTTVHLHGTGRRGAIPGRKVSIDRRKARADRERQVRQLVAEGKSANEIDRLMPGERKAVLALVRKIKAEQAGSAGS